MAQPYIGEIRMFGGNFAPQGWAFCQGQLYPISENEALFQLIGTTYGGDGQETFALPDLQGRAPVHQGAGFQIADLGGAESITLSVQQMAIHNHRLFARGANASRRTVKNNLPGEASKRFYAAPAAPAPMATTSVAPTGGSQPHENMQPFLCVSFIISLFGLWPSQT